MARLAVACVLAVILGFAIVAPAWSWLETTVDPTEYLEYEGLPGQGLYVLSKIVGLYAIVCMWIQAMLGLLREPVIAFTSSRRHARLHRVFGSVTVILIVSHFLLFFSANSLRNGSPALDLFLPNFHGYYRTIVTLGWGALVLVVIAVSAAVLRARLSTHWRSLHRLAPAAFALAFIHSILIGSEARVGPMGWTYLLMAISFCLALGYRGASAYRAKWKPVTAKGTSALLVLGLALLTSSPTGSAAEVVVYTSVDQVFAEPVLKQFEKESGIQVKPLFDAEASKTVGLETRLRSERKKPRADVFWNSEYLRTIRLGTEDVFAPYSSAAAKSIPSQYLSATNTWTGFGLRTRVFLVNTKLVPKEQFPKGLADLADRRWKGRTCLAVPLFGTTSTHFAALYAAWGQDRFVKYLSALKANDAMQLPGNGDVRDAVAEGRCAFGLTDTDDAVEAVRNKKPVAIVFPDQDAEGAFAVFHTVAMVKGGPNPAAAKRLIDYLASKEVEATLLRLGAVQFGVRDGARAADMPPERPKTWGKTGEELLRALAPSAKLVRQHLQ
jgi:iron(III) transport system substrate-binding protein